MIGSASDRTVMRNAQETQRAAQAWGWSASRSRSDGHESVGFTRQSLLSPRASSPRSSPWPIALRNPFGSPKKRAMATSTASGHGNTVIETTNSSSNGRYDWCQTIAPSIGGWPRSSGSSVFKCKTSRIGPSGPWPSGGCARSSSRSLATPDSSPGSIGPTDSSLTSVHRYAW